MSYQDIANMAEDWELRMRLIACAAQEYPENPVEFVDEQIWRICGQPGWGDAWQYSRLTHADDPDFEIGLQEDVITDGMILSGMQHVVDIVLGKKEAVELAAVAAQAEMVKAEDERAIAVFAAQREIELANPIIPIEVPVAPPEAVQLPYVPEPEVVDPNSPPPATGPFEERPL